MQPTQHTTIRHHASPVQEIEPRGARVCHLLQLRMLHGNLCGDKAPPCLVKGSGLTHTMLVDDQL